MYTNPFLDMLSNAYCCLNACGMIFIGIFMYSNRSMGVSKYIFLMFTHIYLACGVLITLFHTIFVVVRSAVLVVSSSGYKIILPPAVIRTLLGSVFLWSVINYDAGICYHFVFGNGAYLVMGEKKYSVCSFYNSVSLRNSS